MRKTLVSLCAVAALAAGTAHAAPIDGTFNYQGRLTSGGAPITGNADVKFILWDAAVGGSQAGPVRTFLNVPVTDGLFDADIDFGVGAFNGDERWLQVDVRSPAGVGSYVTLGRQQIRGTPYAIQTRGLYVDDALNVGVGTTSPDEKLHVAAGDLRVDGDLWLYDSSGTQPLVHSYSHPDGKYWVFQNGNTGYGTFAAGTSEGDGAGFLSLFDDSTMFVLGLDADRDNVSDGVEEGLMYVRSRGAGGTGGLISVQNNDGDETISLLGGGSRLAGSFTTFDSSGSALVQLSEDLGAGRLRLFDPTNGYEYLEMHVDGSAGGGGLLFIDRNNINDIGFEVNGNYLGTESARVEVNGASRSIVLDTSVAGNDSVALPVDAIESTEVLDEPGVAGYASDSIYFFGTPLAAILSRTITVPESGYCFVIATGQANCNHSPGTTSRLYLGVSDTADSLPDNQDVLLKINASAGLGLWGHPVTVHGMFTVSPGSNTFYFLGQEDGGDWTITNMQLSVMYFPTAYGTVTPTVFARGGGDEPVIGAMSPGEIRGEQLEAAAFDRNRRDAELAEMRTTMERLSSQVENLQRQLDDRPPCRAHPPSGQGDDTTGEAVTRGGTDPQ